MWGRSLAEVEAFPQAIGYSLHFLRARAGFLQVHERDTHSLHRLLRTADRLFATKLAKSTVEQYQAFARAVKRGGGLEAYDAHDVLARAPGGGGTAYDWGETPLAEMIEQLGPDLALATRGVLHAELSAVEKYMAFNNEMLAKDRKVEAELRATRRAIRDFLDDDAHHVGEADVSPVGAAPPGAS